MIATLIVIWLLINLFAFFLLIKPERRARVATLRLSLVVLAVRIRKWISRS